MAKKEQVKDAYSEAARGGLPKQTDTSKFLEALEEVENEDERKGKGD